MIARKHEYFRGKLNLGEESMVLLINTEGDTDPDNFTSVVKGKDVGLSVTGLSQ